MTIIEKLGGWPMTMSSSAWSRKEVSWQRIAQYYASIVGGYSLFTIGIQPDAENSSVQILTVRGILMSLNEFNYTICVS